MDNSEKYEGLNGWLILLGIGIAVSPIRQLVKTIQLFQPIFTDGTWEFLTTKGSEAYHHLWAPLLIGEVIYNVAIVFASVYLAFLFFTKHYRFPAVYIWIFVITLFVIPFDSWLFTFIDPHEPIFDPETTKEFAVLLITGLIWTPYLLISKRVKATFVEKLPNRQMDTTDKLSNDADDIKGY